MMTKIQEDNDYGEVGDKNKDENHFRRKDDDDDKDGNYVGEKGDTNDNEHDFRSRYDDDEVDNYEGQNVETNDIIMISE